MLAILDYEAGNQTSVRRALDYLGIACRITADPELLEDAEGVIFPGVGAAGQAMGRLAASGLDKALSDVARHGVPVLGICLGCQILLDHSEENDTRTLGLARGECRRFDPALRDENGHPIRIPHMGWNTLERKRDSPLLRGVPENAAFYFVHSYYAVPEQRAVIATCRHGVEFCAVYGQDGLWAVQFHPEKSGKPGLRVLANFYDWCRNGRPTERQPQAVTADE